MNDLRLEVVNIVKTIMFGKESCTYKLYCYPDISDKVIKNFKKNLNSDININEVSVIIDTSLLNNGKEGLVFTTRGIYIKQMFSKKYYFNYADIRDISSGQYIRVELQNGFEVNISYTGYSREDFISALYKLQYYFLKTGLSSRRHSGILRKQKMQKELCTKCNKIIHTASVAAGGIGTGLAQIPCSDSAVITPIQIGMIVALGQVFDLHITDGTAKGIIGGMVGAIVGRGIVQVAVGWIPGVGNAINTATAAGLTEAIGWAAANQFYQQRLDNLATFGGEGEIKGYTHASEMYENKLREQAAEFLRQKKVCEEQKDKLNALIDEYEKYIYEHQIGSGENRNESSIRVLTMRKEYDKLKEIRSIS